MSPGRNSRLRTVGLLTLGLVGTGQVICAKDGTFLPPILPEVVVTGNYPTSPKDTYYSDQLSLKKYTRPQVDTPQSVTSVPRQLMDDTNASTMREVLKNVPGISLAAGEGGAQGDNLTIRGFTARNDIFLDGIRDFGSYYRDSFNWENVEVLKGPASVSFGRGSTGGVVNQVSKAPVKGAHLTGEETVGTAGKQRATLDVNEPLTNNAAIRLNVMAESSKVADRDIVESRRYGIAPSLALGMGTGTRMTLSYFYQQSDDIPDYGIPYLFNAPAPVSRHNFYGFKSDFLNTRANVVTIKAEHDLNDVTMLTNQFRYGHYTRKMRATEARIAGSPTIETPLDSITINRNEINTDSTETAFFNQFDSVSQFKTGDIEHTLVMGAEIAKETSNPTRYTIAGVPTTGLANPDESQSFSGTNTARTITDVISNSLGFYGIDTIKLFEQWEFTGGARWDQFNTVYSQNAASPSSFSATDRFTSWRGAVTYKPVEDGSLYIGYGNSFNPSAEALSLSASNQGLAPEENITYEAGAKWEWFKKKLLTRLAIFKSEKLNARETDPSNSALTVLAGNQSVIGLELEATGQISEQWQVSGGYAFMRSRLESSRFFPNAVGSPLANVPRNTFNFWTTYRVANNLTIGGGANFVDSRRASTTSPNDPTTGLPKQVPSYWVFNAMAAYDITKSVQLQLNIYNLTDAYFIEQVHPSHLIPGEGRTAVVSMKVKL